MSAFVPKRTSADRSSGVPELTPGPFPVCYFEPARCLVLSLGGGNETARVHIASRRGGGVAARGAGAAAWRDTPRRSAHERGRGRSVMASPRHGLPASIAAAGLDRRPQRADRHPL